MKPFAVDLCCGLGGWTEGLLAEGWDVVGFDIERHVYGKEKYPAQLVLQDILTLDGRQFRGKVSLITASPPCKFFSYCAMPWSRAKALAARTRADPLLIENELALFNACVRIGKEAECPIIIENVKGAQPWVGRARWSFGSFYLWGDVPALMPPVHKATKVPGFRFDGGSFQTAAVQETGFKTQGMNWSDRSKTGQDFTRIAGNQAIGRKTEGAPHIRDGEAHAKHLTNPFEHTTTPDEHAGVKVSGDWFGSYAEQKARGQISPGRMHGKNSPKRKFASAMIAKIPEPLSRHIARTFHPGGTLEMLKLQAYGMLAGIILAAVVLIWPIVGSFRKALLSCLIGLPITCGLLWLIAVHLPPGYGTP